MNDETMKNEKNSGVSDAAVSGPLWTHPFLGAFGGLSRSLNAASRYSITIPG